MRAGITHGRVALNVLLAVLALVLSLLPSPTPAAAQPAGCTFTLGFRALRDQIPQIVGDCVENEHFNPSNGNAEQRTARGLLVWRKADNWTAFTDGATTWINGPAGLASRPNAGPLFPWESRTAPAAAPSGSGMATERQSGWATVAQVLGPSTLTVRNDAGERFNVWQIGIIGPTEGQGDWLRRAAAEQSNRIPPGTRVWLQAEDGLDNPDEGWVLRHVLRDADPEKPIGAELVRAGGVWVFPHAFHRYTQLYADLQAEAVVTRTGAWAETPSSAVFRPRGVTGGGYPINPAVEPALRVLDASQLGHDLLVKVNSFPVEIGISPRQESVAYFSPRYYSVQLNDDVMTAPPEAIAAVLIHEITHARQMADRAIEAKDIGCYESEVEAFVISAQYWRALYGPGGKPRPAHWLDRELNDTLRQYENNQLAERVRRSYGRQCGR